MPRPGRDRLRELLDAVLDEDNATLEQMAGDAYASPYHLSRVLSRDAGEAPVAMRRRVMLERAAWELRHGTSVTDAAWRAGYDSVEGFSRAFARAFGHPPSAAAARPAGSHWLPAPNGIHFHPPMHLWVHAEEPTMNPVTEQLVRHDLDDTRDLLERASGLAEEEWTRRRLPGHTVLEWDGPEESLAAVLHRHVASKEIWLASIAGHDAPPSDDRPPSVAELLERHDVVAARWLATVRDIERRGGWGDRLVDALCEPPESFVLSSVLTHVLTYAAHRRQVARQLLRAAGVPIDDGDPIRWLRRQLAETRAETNPTGDPA